MNTAFKNILPVFVFALVAMVFAFGVFSYANAAVGSSNGYSSGYSGSCCGGSASDSSSWGGAGGASTVYIPQTYHYAAPNCSLSVNDSSITSGQSVTLSWSSNNARNASLSGFGAVSLHGSKTVSPTQTTTYTLTVSGQGGTKTCSKTVTVTNPPVCPAGTTGTYPNCSTPVCPAGTTGTYPNCTVPTPSCPTGTSGNYPNCAVNQVQCPSGTISAGNNICIVNVNNNQNNNQNIVTVNVPASTYTNPNYPTYNNPICSLTASQTNVAYGQPVTISWSSNNASSGFINNNIGSVNSSGSRVVYPNTTTTYTGTFYGYNGQSVNCSTTVTVGGYTYNNTPYVTLSAVPYTGLDLGPTGTALYWAFLVAWCLFAAYLIAIKRVHMSIYRWYSKMLFGSAATRSVVAAPAPASKIVYEAPVVASATTDAIDPFIMSQINRAN